MAGETGHDAWAERPMRSPRKTPSERFCRSKLGLRVCSQRRRSSLKLCRVTDPPVCAHQPLCAFGLRPANRPSIAAEVVDAAVVQRLADRHLQPDVLQSIGIALKALRNRQLRFRKPVVAPSVGWGSCVAGPGHHLASSPLA
ncbi:hypothetical protein [Belnapia moabensis]|uniref:hypothetical protein n=1 Tax=Belnapia moabensis TaxID=365533 RepID=UPI0012EE2FE0|nr:hypothetical protein [Belnapia moabensis]